MKTQDDRKNKWLKLEDIRLEQEYSFSLNPLLQPEFNEKTKSMQLIKYKKNIVEWNRKFYNLFRSLNELVTVRLYLECSPNGRYHYHGYIWVHNIEMFPMFIITINEIGASEMDTIEDEDKWGEYVRKQLSITFKLFKNNSSEHPLRTSVMLDPDKSESELEISL